MGPPSALLERDEALSELHSALARARAGDGEVAVVTGEAGAGKTSVIREFVRRSAGRPLVLQGACDPLSAPRPLGPLIDVAGEIDADLAARLAAGMPRAEAFAAAVTLVDGSRSDGRVTVLVIEDVHWADDATLDLVTFLGRRIAAIPALMVLSYRDDEVDAHHPLRPRLGDLAAAIRSRVRLPPLSRDAVAALAADTTIDPDRLHRTTGGNAFFVTEVLGADRGALPESVRDAVLARASRLAPHARSVLDAAAIVPGRVERWLLDAISGEADTAVGLDTCIDRGLLRLDATGAVGFRHELARLAIEEALPGTQRRRFHVRALAALRDPPIGEPEVVRLAHHANEAGDARAVLEFAPAAAQAASAVGSHREAASHLEAALRCADRLPVRQQAELHARLARELTTLSRWEDALHAYGVAARLFEQIGDRERQAQAIVRCDRALWGLGRQPEALRRVRAAEALLDPTRPSHAAALVATSLTTSHMLAREFEQAEIAGRRAIDIAATIQDDDVLAEACIVSGISMTMGGDDAGLDRVRRGIDLATRRSNDQLVTLGHLQIGSGLGELRRYDEALAALRTGIAFAEEREIVWAVLYMRAWLARCELELGHWDAAARVAGELLRTPRCLGNSRLVALVTLGWLRARRGDPDVEELLDEALALARTAGHVQRLWPVAACRADVAWLAGRLSDERDLIEEVAAVAHRLGYRPAIEELDHWRRLDDGASRGDATTATTPFGLSAAGRPDLAARRWAEIGCPYEEAMARFAMSTPEALRAALATFDRLDAAPMRERTVATLRELGEAVPRGPTASTRANPFELTDRELDVLALLATGRTNREIGDDLGISVKTAGHHVSHVLAKLDVRTRSEAAVVAERLGLGAAHDRPA